MKQLGWIIAIIAILGGAYWWWQGSSASPSIDTGASSAVPGTESAAVQGTPMPVVGSVTEEMIVTAPMTATVTYTSNGFSPKEVTVKKGGTVMWKNTSGGKMWVASAQHPSHTVYAGTTREEHCPDTARTAFDQCVGGGDYSFTFDKVGTWGYHDHLKSSFFGKITVIE